MPYLLLNGTSTENLATYLRDVLFLNFRTIPQDIPFNNSMGIRRFILEEALVDYIDKVRDEVSLLLNKLNDRHNATLSLQSIVTKDSSNLVITINLDTIDIEEYIVPVLTS